MSKDDANRHLYGTYMDDVEKFLFDMLSNNEKVMEGSVKPLRLILYKSPYSYVEPTIYWVTIEYADKSDTPQGGLKVRSSLYETLEKEINSKVGRHLKAYFNMSDYLSYQLDITCVMPIRDWFNLYKERGLFE